MFAYCLSASAMRCGFSLVKTDTCLAGKIFSDEMFQHPISISNKPNGNLWPKDSNWTCLTLKCLWRVCFWPGDFRLIYGFSKEKEFMFLDRESLDRVSNSKAPFVFVLDFSMAENQRPEVTANAAETEVPTPAPDREAVPSDYSSNVRVWSLTSGLELESLPWWSWRSTGAYVHLHYDTFMEWALCKCGNFDWLSGYRWIWQETLPWTAPSTNTWVNQPILPCQRLGCMQGNSMIQRATTGTNLLAEYSYVVVERYWEIRRVFCSEA